MLPEAVRRFRPESGSGAQHVGAVPVGGFCVHSACGSEAGRGYSRALGAGRWGPESRCRTRRPAKLHGGLRRTAGPTATASRGPPHPRRRLRGAETGRCVQSSASPAEKVSQVPGLRAPRPHFLVTPSLRSCHRALFHQSPILDSGDPQPPLSFFPFGLPTEAFPPNIPFSALGVSSITPVFPQSAPSVISNLAFCPQHPCQSFHRVPFPFLPLGRSGALPAPHAYVSICPRVLPSP